MPARWLDGAENEGHVLCPATRVEDKVKVIPHVPKNPMAITDLPQGAGFVGARPF